MKNANTINQICLFVCLVFSLFMSICSLVISISIFGVKYDDVCIFFFFFLLLLRLLSFFCLEMEKKTQQCIMCVWSTHRMRTQLPTASCASKPKFVHKHMLVRIDSFERILFECDLHTHCVHYPHAQTRTPHKRKAHTHTHDNSSTAKEKEICWIFKSETAKWRVKKLLWIMNCIQPTKQKKHYTYTQI